jgi:hypothetical protein
MRIWNLPVLVFLFAAPGYGQTTSNTTVPSIPILQEAALPMYPPIWRTAHLNGKVTVLVTVRNGRVVGTDVKSGIPELQYPTTANLKTWRFADEVNCTFTVTYTYVISGEESDTPTNPKTEVLPSLDVNIVARPVKPTVNY